MKAKALTLAILKAVIPPWLYWRLLAWKVGIVEQEMKLLPALCDPDRVSIDVGASGGGYTVNLLNLSKACVAFEPIPWSAKALREKLYFPGLQNLRIEAVALSDGSGEAVFKIPVSDAGRSTLAETNPVEELGDVQYIPIQRRQLDEYEFPTAVGLIKIDVEGHEEAVLRGARKLLMRDHPALIIEIESRHNPGSIERVKELLNQFGYKGYFLRGDNLYSIANFDEKRDQNPNDLKSNPNWRNVYINNFIFVTESHLPRLKKWFPLRTNDNVVLREV